MGAVKWSPTSPAIAYYVVTLTPSGRAGRHRQLRLNRNTPCLHTGALAAVETPKEIRMARKLSIVVNNAAFSAHPGEILLDAALNQGIKIPHDCRAGQCGTCLIRVKQGELLGGETAQPNMYRACQARVFSDVRISYDRLPA